MLIEPDGSVRIAWQADGYEAIHVHARFRERDELEAYARGVADAALFERTVADLRVALRKAYPGEFDLSTKEPASGAWRVDVRFHPPRREGRPDLV
ncbi:MAG: hypothetical protein U0869_02195 [Chloroflexota bacterium]